MKADPGSVVGDRLLVVGWRLGGIDARHRGGAHPDHERKASPGDPRKDRGQTGNWEAGAEVRSGERPRLWITLTTLGLILLTACVVPPDVGLSTGEPATPGGPPTATLPPPLETLVVCLRDEPESLYLYADGGPEANAILEAVYDGPIDSRSYSLQPVVVEKIPSLADGDARIESVAVAEGDVYFNPETLQPDNLQLGSPYWPAGCREGNCAETFGGGRVRMDQIVAEFRLRPEIRWSDGQPVLASDSVFSFELDADPATPSTKYLVDRTYSYEAVDERTVRWTGIPGLWDGSYAGSFWPPLPEHRLGTIAAADLAAAEPAARLPLGWGPYRIEEWRPGSQIALGTNPEYFRRGEGLPRFERLIFRFLGRDAASGLEQLRTEECDVLDESILEIIPLPAVVSAAQADELRFSAAAGPTEWLEFRVGPHADGDASVLADARTRRGLAQCLDRPGMVAEFTSGLGVLPSTFLPPDHPDFVDPADPITFDPGAGQALLEEAGWADEDGAPSTPRRAQGVGGVADGTELRLRLGTSDDALHTGVAVRLGESLAACGAQVEVQALPAPALLGAWPEGAALSGEFDMILWAWPVLHSPACEMFAGWEIPGEENPSGVNASGWTDPGYDEACRLLLNGLRGEAAYGAAAGLAQERFVAGLPGVPLFLRPRLVATRPEFCGLAADPTSLSVLVDLEAAGRGEACGRPGG